MAIPYASSVRISDPNNLPEPDPNEDPYDRAQRMAKMDEETKARMERARVEQGAMASKNAAYRDAAERGITGKVGIPGAKQGYDPTKNSFADIIGVGQDQFMGSTSPEVAYPAGASPEDKAALDKHYAENRASFARPLNTATVGGKQYFMENRGMRASDGANFLAKQAEAKKADIAASNANMAKQQQLDLAREANAPEMRKMDLMQSERDRTEDREIRNAGQDRSDKRVQEFNNESRAAAFAGGDPRMQRMAAGGASPEQLMSFDNERDARRQDALAGALPSIKDPAMRQAALEKMDLGDIAPILMEARKRQGVAGSINVIETLIRGVEDKFDASWFYDPKIIRRAVKSINDLVLTGDITEEEAAEAKAQLRNRALSAVGDVNLGNRSYEKNYADVASQTNQ